MVQQDVDLVQHEINVWRAHSNGRYEQILLGLIRRAMLGVKQLDVAEVMLERAGHAAVQEFTERQRAHWDGLRAALYSGEGPAWS